MYKNNVKEVFMRKGFTLIELLVVVAIIGILSGVVLVSLSSARNKARDASVQEQVTNLMTATEVYINDNTLTAASESALSASSGLGQALVSNGLISSVPQHPSGANDVTHGYAAITGAGNTYVIWGTLPSKSTTTYFYAKNGATGTSTTKPVLP